MKKLFFTLILFILYSSSCFAFSESVRFSSAVGGSVSYWYLVMENTPFNAILYSKRGAGDGSAMDAAGCLFEVIDSRNKLIYQKWVKSIKKHEVSYKYIINKTLRDQRYIWILLYTSRYDDVAQFNFWW